jgi:SOS response associated peptidase (SRAP)
LEHQLGVGKMVLVDPKGHPIVWAIHVLGTLMCGRYTFQPTEEVYRRFNITNRLDSLVARYNIAPGQMVPVIIAQSPNQVMLMCWGLIPHGARKKQQLTR